MEVIVPIGISGSGKTRLYKKQFPDYALLSPDNIRKEITGSISDQSKNGEVFKAVDARLEKLLAAGEDIFYDATNLNRKFRMEFVRKVKELAPSARITYHILICDPEVSKRRIVNDLINGVDRSDVPDYVIDRQVAMYRDLDRHVLRLEGADEVVWESRRY